MFVIVFCSSECSSLGTRRSGSSNGDGSSNGQPQLSWSGFGSRGTLTSSCGVQVPIHLGRTSSKLSGSNAGGASIYLKKRKDRILKKLKDLLDMGLIFNPSRGRPLDTS